jgi:hypothetical protein
LAASGDFIFNLSSRLPPIVLPVEQWSVRRLAAAGVAKKAQRGNKLLPRRAVDEGDAAQHQAVAVMPPKSQRIAGAVQAHEEDAGGDGNSCADLEKLRLTHA